MNTTPRPPTPDEDTRAAAERLATHDCFVGRPASSVWDLLRSEDYVPPNGRSLFASSASAGTPALGWNPETDEAVMWDGARPLAVHSRWAERVPQLVHIATLVAVQLVRQHGPDAVVVIDADHATADTPDHWRPLQDAGVRIHPVATDPGKAVGALARVADTVTARHRPGPPARSADAAHEDGGPRFVVILHADALVPLLSAYGLDGYAAAARDAVRIITNPRHAHTGVTAVVTTADAPAPPMWSPAGVHRLVTPQWATLEGPDPDTHEWAYQAQGRDVLAVEIPGVLPPWWLAERLTDPRYGVTR